MSDPRRLWVRFRRVLPERRKAYLEAVGSASVGASEAGAHLWAFEVDGGASLFVEFLEGPGDDVLGRVEEAIAGSLSAAGGAHAGVELPSGAETLKCSGVG